MLRRWGLTFALLLVLPALSHAEISGRQLDSLLDAGQYELVVTLAEQGYAADPSRGDLLEDLSQALLMSNQADVFLASMIPADPDNSADLHRSGAAQMRCGMIVDALHTFERLQTLEPDWAWTKFWLGRAHAALGHDQEAIAYFRQAQQTPECRDGAYYREGRLHWERGDKITGDSLYALVDTTAPQFDYIRGDRLYQTALAGDWVTYLRDLQDVAAADASPYTYSNWASALKYQGDYAEARTVLDDALQRWPGNVFLRHQRAELTAAMGLWDGIDE